MQKIFRFLQGHWLRHPLHSIFVHMPVALWPTVLVFDVMSRYGAGDNVLMRTSFFAIGLSLIAVLFAVPTGLVDWAGIKPERPAWKIGFYHMLLNMFATVIWAINLGSRFESFRIATQASATQMILSMFGTLLLAISTYLGGQMVYSYGVSVARISQSKWGRAAAMARANLPEQGK